MRWPWATTANGREPADDVADRLHAAVGDLEETTSELRSLVAVLRHGQDTPHPVKERRA